MVSDSDVEQSLCAGAAIPAPDDEAEAFCETHYRDLVRKAMSLGATREEAEDAVVETLIQLLRRWKKVRKPLAWARKAVARQALKQIERRLDRQGPRLVAKGALGAEGGDDPGLRSLEGEDWVMYWLATLPPRQKEAMALAVDGLTPAEIANVLGRSPDAVRQNLWAARKRLREAMGREGTAAPRSGRAATSTRREER
jgi:RNA polymerase sigma factor (sigma-70 family)